jgi:SWI/SNF-related matrix-associated actin-dependent regulator 1 of chromatin subfamily A
MFRGFKDAATHVSSDESIAFDELSSARLELAKAKLPDVISFASDLLEEEPKLVIFAHHREIIEALAGHFGECAVRLFGGMTDRQKNDAVNRFQHGDARVFVGQITAAGTGLTLTAARTILFAELDWVPGNIIQCEDRCHRLGQKEPVRIFHLTASGSTDAKMIHALVEKQKIIEAVTA